MIMAQFCASMWTSEESEQIKGIARTVCLGIITYALPQGLQVAEGPEAVVKHLIEHVPALLQ